MFASLGLWHSACQTHYWAQLPWVFFVLLGVTLDSAETPLLILAPDCYCTCTKPLEIPDGKCLGCNLTGWVVFNQKYQHPQTYSKNDPPEPPPHQGTFVCSICFLFFLIFVVFCPSFAFSPSVSFTSSSLKATHSVWLQALFPLTEVSSMERCMHWCKMNVFCAF